MSFIRLKNVSVRFRKYSGQSHGLKEAALRFFRPPSWYQNRPPSVSEFWGLRHVTLDLVAGDRLGIIGHNGAGKSTLLKVLSRIYKPTEGELEIQGRVAPLIEIGAGFSGELTGRENIFLNAAIMGLSRKVMRSKVNDIIEFSGLREFIETPVKYYSTGMYLRLAFTIATEVKPDILILDELYAGGDASFIEKASHRLEAFVQQSKIMILVAHDLDYVNRFCNRALVLDHGQIRVMGKPDEVVERYLAHCGGDTTAYPPLSST